MTRLYVLLAVAALVVVGILATTAGGDDDDLRARVAKLTQEIDRVAKENEKLRGDVDRLRAESRSLAARIATLDEKVHDLERQLSNAEKDLRSRLVEMVGESRYGRRTPRRVPQMRVRTVKKPYMGFDAQDLLPEVVKELNLTAKTGVLVTDVREGAPAAVAGLRKKDVVTGIDATPIKSFSTLKKIMKDKKPGQEIALTVMRGDKQFPLKIKLGAKEERVREDN